MDGLTFSKELSTIFSNAMQYNAKARPHSRLVGTPAYDHSHKDIPPYGVVHGTAGISLDCSHAPLDPMSRCPYHSQYCSIEGYSHALLTLAASKADATGGAPV